MDRVKFEALERADLEDVKALTDLAYEYDQRALGALLGASDLSTYDGGLLSGPEVTYDHGNGQITLSSFTFVEFTAGGAPVDSNGNSLSPEARVIRFDSSKSGHNNHPIDVSSARTVGTTYTLYARSIQVASDASARRRWDVSSQSEVSYSPTTRFRERVDFAVGTSRPTESTTAGDGQWAPLLTYSVSSAGALSYTPISALDNADVRAIALQQAGLSPVHIDSHDFITSSGTQSKSHGLLSLLSAIKLALYRNLHLGQLDTLYTPSATAKWFSAPPLSTKEIKLRIEQLETNTSTLSQVTSPVVCIATETIRLQRTAAGGNHDFIVTSTYGHGVSAVRASPTRSNRVCVQLSSSLLLQPWHISHVSCTQHMVRTSQGNNNYDYNRAVFLPDLSHSNSSLTQTYLNDANAYHLDDYSTTSGRGVNIEVLPLHVTSEESINDQQGGVNTVGSDTTNDNLFIDFSIAIYAIHQSQVTS